MFFSDDTDKTIVSLLNLTLILNPVISLIFSTVYFYNSREFIELLISQPIRRLTVFAGLYLGVSFTLILIFVFSIGIPFIINSPENYPILLVLFISGSLLTLIYVGIAIGIAHLFDDRAAGLGAVLMIWLFFAVLYDGIILFGTFFFSDYPLELPVLFASIFNPIDLGRITVMLKLNYAALMGYTGAVFEKFFGNNIGIIITFSAMILWVIIPIWIAKHIFEKKDF